MKIIEKFRKTRKNLSNWLSCQEARFSFAHFGNAVKWHSEVDWQGSEKIYIQDGCIIMPYANLYANIESAGTIKLEPKVTVSKNALLQTKNGNIQVGENSFIGNNSKIIAQNGDILIGNNVVIQHDVEIITDNGDITIGNDTKIDSKCWIRSDGSNSDGQQNRGIIILGEHNYIGYASILEANGGYIKAEKEVKIDYQNIIGGKGGVYFESRAHLRHSNYVDAFKEEFRFGEHITVGQKCIFAGRGSIKIGAKSMIGGLTFMVSENHKVERTDTPYRYQGHSYQGITLEENVWIGGQTLVLDGVLIGTGSLIGGGAVVVKNIEPWSFAAGVPAQKKKDLRDK